jgi:hypothetical protein
MKEGPETYRAKAIEMRRRAQSAHDLGTRLAYLELAEQWGELARAIKRREGQQEND